MAETKLSEAIDWFFDEGYRQLAKNPKAVEQSAFYSAICSIRRAAKVLNLPPSEILLISYNGYRNGRKKQ